MTAILSVSDRIVSRDKWTRNSFAVTVYGEIIQLSTKCRESQIELKYDVSLKLKFEALPLLDFWICIRDEYLESHNYPTMY